MDRVYHVLGIGHCPTSRLFSTNPFAQNTRMMCAILNNLRFKTYHYGVEGSTALCDEHISVVMQSELEAVYGKDYKNQRVDLNTVDQRYTTGLFDTRTVHEIEKRAQPGDFVLVTGGTLHQAVVSALDEIGVHPLEPACGYENIFTRYRVFPSHTWQSYCYAKWDSSWEAYKETLNADEQHSENYLTTSNPISFLKPCDDVIPHGCFPEDFTIAESREDYIFHISRLIPSKGIEMAIKVSKHLGRKLVIAGQGDFEKNMGFKPPSHVELVGALDVEARNHWMGQAFCTMSWTINSEPFGYVPVESMFCGVAPVTSNRGAFTETVKRGVSGFRTTTFKETCERVEACADLDPDTIRQYAMDNYSIDAVSPRYGNYFRGLDAHLKATEAGESFYS
ncbi:MAG: glycosyltransferase [Candidatus Poribacteria bacterium]|nr:glycosyltransferase [Candidatus Poribacteria bacterium]